MNLRAYFATLTITAALGACGGGGDDSGTNIADGGGAILPQHDAAVTDSGAPNADTGSKPTDGGTTATDAATSNTGSDSGSSTSSDAGANDAGARDSGSATAGDAGGGKPDAGTMSMGGSDAGSSTGSSMACTQCEQKWCTKLHLDYDPTGPLSDLTTFCSTLPGNAAAGPKSGMPRSTLCNNYVACASGSSCAENSYLGCLCGDEKQSVCQQESPIALKGVCRNEYLALAETTDWKDLANRINATASAGAPDPTADLATVAISGANLYLQCITDFCSSECYGTCAGAADGASCQTDPENNDTAVRSCKSGKCPISVDATGVPQFEDGFVDMSVYADGGV